MKTNELAKKLQENGITEELVNVAVKNDLVILFGESDDLAEFEGTFLKEVSCWNGGRIYEGVPVQGEEMAYIDANFNNGVWTYETNIPHATFDLLKDNKVVCKGLVMKDEDMQFEY